MSFCTRLARLTLFCVLPASLAAQTKGIPDWCKPLPRPEYEEEHIAGAINLPLKELNPETARQLDRSRPAVVYCNDYQ